MEQQLRQQNLQLMIQNVLLVQQFQAYATGINITISELKSSIPKPHEIDKLVEEKLRTKIELFDASRESAIKHLNRLTGEA